MQRGAGSEEPAGKPAAGKIARPTILCRQRLL